MLIFRRRRGRSDAPVFRVHDLKAYAAAAHFTETSQPNASREPLLLLRREIKDPQRQNSGPIGDAAQHLPPTAQHHFGELHLALDGGTLSGAKLA